MKQKSYILLLVLLLATLTSCSPGHSGSNEIAFVRDGHLWTSDPDGANAFEVVVDTTPVVGYAWSPTHQILVYRTLDSHFVHTPASKQLSLNPITGVPGDAPANLNTIGIDGGTPIPIVFSNPTIRHSNAWWNSTGNRLLYREYVTRNGSTNPASATWWIAQNDQPAGIARKGFPTTFSIPSITSDGHTIVANGQYGAFTTDITGNNIHFLIQQRLAGHPLSATLERLLWQPDHSAPVLLYAVEAPTSQESTSQFRIQLMLQNARGETRSIVTCTCTQFAWSPDGNSILYKTETGYSIFNLLTNRTFSFSTELHSIPYWSPDSRFLLFDGLHTLSLLQLSTHKLTTLLQDSSAPDNTFVENMETNALLQPALNSPWASDSHHFLFLTRTRLLWGSASVLTKGLYTVTIDDQGKVMGSPTSVDAGNDTQAGWTYEDANTSFLF